jgi:hypothetical protein
MIFPIITGRSNYTIDDEDSIEYDTYYIDTKYNNTCYIFQYNSYYSNLYVYIEESKDIVFELLHDHLFVLHGDHAIKLIIKIIKNKISDDADPIYDVLIVFNNVINRLL